MDYEAEAKRPLVTDDDRVEIIMLTVGNDRDVAADCITRILNHVRYPFKLTIYENSLNSTNTAKIWNKLIKQSTCGYICLIDSDAIPMNDFISLMMEVFKRYPDAAAIGPAGDDSSFVNEYQKVYNPNAEEFSMIDNLSGFCFLFKKEIMERYGYFDERFVFYGQDSEWTHRMSIVSRLQYVVPKAYVNHKDSVSSYRKQAINKDFSRIEDVTYARALLQKIKDTGEAAWKAEVTNVDCMKYNPWKSKIPIPGLNKI